MYLFDTDIVTNVFKKQPSRKLISKLASIPRRFQNISSVTVSEIVYGAWKSPKPDYHLKNLQEVLLPSVNVIGFDSKSAYFCGKLRAELEKSGTPLALADLEIASIALANELILVTGNTVHFERITSLSVENWLAD